MKDDEVDVIPNVLSRTYDSEYGGVILSQPLSPTILPSFYMKPYKLPPDVLIKLAFSVLTESDKAILAKKLEDIADKDAQDVGEFVSEFLTDRSVSIKYFFGNLNTDEFGLIFKEHALKRDISSLVFEEAERFNLEEAKSEVTFRDAELFLMNML